MAVTLLFLISSIVITAFFMRLGELHSAELLEVKPPIESGRTLSRQELRYCRFESIRIATARDTLESKSDHLETRYFQAFNASIEDYNLRCSNYRYYEDDDKVVDSDVSVNLPQLIIEGGDLERLDRQHQNSLWHVTADVLNLRNEPYVSGAVIARLNKYQDVIRTGSPRNEWLPVRLGELTGYVSLRYVSRGSGSESKRLECIATAGASPENGEILHGTRNGQNEIVVRNGLKRDALFKLKRRDRGTELSFYVKSGSNARVEGIRDGAYKLIFATGLEYNQAWNRFCSQGSPPRAFENYEPFESTQSQYTSIQLTLHPVVGGNSSAREVEEREAFYFWED